MLGRSLGVLQRLASRITSGFGTRRAARERLAGRFGRGLRCFGQRLGQLAVGVSGQLCGRLGGFLLADGGVERGIGAAFGHVASGVIGLLLAVQSATDRIGLLARTRGLFATSGSLLLGLRLASSFERLLKLLDRFGRFRIVPSKRVFDRFAHFGHALELLVGQCGQLLGRFALFLAERGCCPCKLLGSVLSRIRCLSGRWLGRLTGRVLCFC